MRKDERPREVTVRLPGALAERLRRLSYEEHRSQNKILTDAFTLYDEVVRRRRASERVRTPVEEAAPPAVEVQG